MAGEPPIYGELRPSQIITTYGPGSIVDFPSDSAIIKLINEHTWLDPTPIFHARLQAKLGVDEFRVPGTGRFAVPATQFPKYHVCSGCGAIRSDFVLSEKAKPMCTCRGHVAPARFVIGCKEGHIDDFPWTFWAHLKKGMCENPKLRERIDNTKAGLEGYWVHCETCGAQNNLGDIFNRTIFNRYIKKCRGTKPWVSPSARDNCNEAPVVMQRGASNVYFPSIESSLYIPEDSNELNEKLGKYMITLKTIDNPEIMKTVLSGIHKTDPNLNKFPLEQILSFIDDSLWPAKTLTSDDLRCSEWEAFTETKTPYYDQDFSIRDEDVPHDYSKLIDRVILCERLREIRILKGFRRVEPYDPEQEKPNSLKLVAPYSCEWLPACEIKGEGIFIKLNETEVSKWEEKTEVKERYAILIGAYNSWRANQGQGRSKHGPRFYLIHTLAHLFIKQLSLECGYSSASIRERIYADGKMVGFLIYTGSPDSDGSLGGLVEMGTKKNMYSLLENTIKSAETCSMDPVCSEITPTSETLLNAASCHACVLVSETSCEFSNRLLDRALIKGLPNSPRTGYFK